MTTLPPAEVARGIFAALAKKDLDAAFENVAEDSADDFVAIGPCRASRPFGASSRKC